MTRALCARLADVRSAAKPRDRFTCVVRTYDPLFRCFSIISPQYRTYVPLFTRKPLELASFSPNNGTKVRNHSHFRLFPANSGSSVRSP